MRYTIKPNNQCLKALVDKIKKAATFNQGYATTELVSAATSRFGLAFCK